VSPRIAPSLEPAITGWLAHENPFVFDTGPTRRDAGARRFWTGTPAIPAFAVAREGYAVLARAGVPAIREKSLRLTGRMIALADEMKIKVGSPREPERRGGSVALDIPDAERVCKALLAQDVLLDFRPGVGLRLAPHFYTRDEEIDDVMGRVRTEMKKGAA
jgi:kynureninase